MVGGLVGLARLVEPPVDVIGRGGGFVLVNEVLNHLSRIVQFVQVIFEQILFSELLKEGFAFAQFVVVYQC